MPVRKLPAMRPEFAHALSDLTERTRIPPTCLELAPAPHSRMGPRFRPVKASVAPFRRETVGLSHLAREFRCDDETFAIGSFRNRFNN